MLTPEEWSALFLSMRVALLALLVLIIPGVACAWLLARRSFPGKSLLDAVLHLPLVLPPVVVGYVLLVLFGREGPFGRWLGLDIAFTTAAAALASAVVAFPLFVRALRLSIELVDRRIETAARTLGASPIRVFLTITLPLSLPGLLTGALLAFARALGEFGATITFAGNIEGETRTLPLAIFTNAQIPGGDAAAMRLVVISVALSLAAMIIAEYLARSVRRRIGAGA